MLGAAALLGVAAISVSANAKSNNVEELYRKCKSDGIEKTYCAGFLTGAAMRMYEGAAKKMDNPADREFLLCGEDVTGGVIIQAFINWAEKHPEKWGEEMRVGVNAALHEMWPCK